MTNPETLIMLINFQSDEELQFYSTTSPTPGPRCCNKNNTYTSINCNIDKYLHKFLIFLFIKTGYLKSNKNNQFIYKNKSYIIIN